MTYSFLGFTLDEARRELRRGEEEIPLQPLVFDLLQYLIRHRDRVVGKQELLGALWPDAIVAEGSLTRAISLARTALSEGGEDRAIRTFARQGYRFVAEVEDAAAGPPAPVDVSDPEVPSGPLSDAIAACGRNAWEDSLDLFEQADAIESLAPPHLERWAFAARCAGKGGRARGPLERAVAGFSMASQRVAAARAALMLALIQLERQEMAVARGWLRRAERLLEAAEECAEHGHLAWVQSKFASEEGDHAGALRLAELTYELGRRRGDSDLEALGLLQRGAALLALGRVREGAALQDEAAAVVLSARVTPLAGGTVFCGVLFGCRNGADWQRAAQWSRQFHGWCERQRLGNFSGPCRLHRAEVLGVQGELTQAESEAEAAAGFLSDSAPWAVGEAMRVLGDLRLSRGDLEGAESAYRRCHELGWTAQPGFALLRLRQGKVEAAYRELERTIEDPGWANRQRRGLLLASFARVAVAAGRPERAHAALEELDANPELCRTPALKAEVGRARAEVAFAEGEPEGGISLLRQVLGLWREIDAPAQLAGTRLRLAEALASNGERDEAELELSAAEALYRRIGAGPMVEQCRQAAAALRA